MLGFSWRYQVYIKGVDDPWNEVCDNLWKGLHVHNFACLPTNKYCGPSGHPDGGTNHIMEWAFDSSLFCNAGHVASGFWAATHNKYGAMDQRLCRERM